ncbi:MAG: hypothetical protein IH593_01015 [Bacteroidales bacterium]|nr:hypothetical protein [Bacteroidales bacterium]
MKLTFLPAILLFTVIILSCSTEDKWDLAAVIEKEIQTTSFPADTFNIADFGAQANDTSVLSTEAIIAAIKECNSAGGGVVRYQTGSGIQGL